MANILEGNLLRDRAAYMRMHRTFGVPTDRKRQLDEPPRPLGLLRGQKLDELEFGRQIVLELTDRDSRAVSKS